MNTPRAATRRSFIGRAAATAGMLAAPALAPTLALAQAYPSRPIRLICPWPAGGTSDTQMRVFATSVAKALNANVIVENKPGAGGMFGPMELVNAKPDGYTISQLTIGIVRVPHMQKTSFDPLKDISYVACLSGFTFGMVVRADSPFKTMKDVVDWARANPGKLTYASSGMGTTLHLLVEDLAIKQNIQLQHVPYKGVPDSMQALLGGHVMAQSESTGWKPHVDTGAARLLATYGTRRTRSWPTVPTLLELGYGVSSDSPYGIGAPRGTDPVIVRTLHDAFKHALTDPAVTSVLDTYDQSVAYMDSAEYTRWVHDSFVKERELIQRLGLAAKS